MAVERFGTASPPAFTGAHTELGTATKPSVTSVITVNKGTVDTAVTIFVEPADQCPLNKIPVVDEGVIACVGGHAFEGEHPMLSKTSQKFHICFPVQVHGIDDRDGALLQNKRSNPEVECVGHFRLGPHQFEHPSARYAMHNP